MNISKKTLNFILLSMLLMLIFSGQIVSAQTITNYQEYANEHQNEAFYEGKPIVYSFDEGLKIDNQEVKSFDIEVPLTGWYHLKFEYRNQSNSILPFSYQLKVDGLEPFKEAINLILRTEWTRQGAINKDRYGNEIVPEVVRVDQTLSSYIMDKSGLMGNNIAIFLEQGKHQIEMECIEGDILLDSVSLVNNEQYLIGSIEQVENSTNENLTVEIEGENVYKQNAPYIRPVSVFNNQLTPYNNEFKILNTLDGNSFKNAGDKIEYQINIPKDGLYQLSLKYEQSAQVDFPVFWDILVDNQVYNESLLSYGIPYSSVYGLHTLVDKSNKELEIYLTKGEHIISFEITRAPLARIITETEVIIDEINQLSQAIELVLGGVVDKNRDVNLNEYIDDVPGKLIGWADRLSNILTEIKTVANSETVPGAFSQIELAETHLRKLAAEPRTIANRWNELAKGGASVTSKLAALLQSQLNNGVSIDKFWLHQGTIDPKNPGFVQNLTDGLQRFYYSFQKQDYAINPESENLQVWVNRPRQYIEILQTIADQYFTPETGIKVDFSLMPNQNKLILANSAGNQPDIALGVGYALPFDLAIRDALVDLSQFTDYQEVVDSVAPNLLIPAMIGEKSYAIPETMNFYVMFYRKDILDQLGMGLPETVQDMAELMPILKQRGMGIFYPTASLGTSFKIFPWTMPIVYQNGGNFFGDSILKSGLEMDETIEGMKQLTDLFTVYSLPVDVPSFYQEFRNGTIPLGISDFGSYILMLNAAPEIANLWDIALIPGYENENNEIERWSSGGAESSVMFEASDQKENAWKFLKWWHSKEIQLKFGTTLQTYYGQEYMWNTANLEAFAELPWSSKHKEIILDQSEWIMEVPRVLGGYMVEREVSRLYTSVVVDGDNLRKSNDLSIKRINREILKKLEEFGYMKDGQWIEEYQMPAEPSKKE